MSELSDEAAFRWPVRVYWEDTDAGGVVYHSNYLRFMERARTEWLRARGIDQSELRESTGVVMVVSSVQCDFLRSARLDDELLVEVAVGKVGGASFTMEQRVLRADGELLLRGTIKAGCLDAERWTPTRLPPELRAAIAAP